MIHRIATSNRYKDSLFTIETEWGLEELFVAHEMLDALEDLELRSMPQGER